MSLIQAVSALRGILDVPRIIAIIGLLSGPPVSAVNIAADGGVHDAREYLDGRPTNARMFGASPTGTAAQNLAAIQAAVDATPTGGMMLIPRNAAGDYSIDTSGGLSSAILINRKMTIVIEGHMKMTTGDQKANPPYLFKITAADVKFIVDGSLRGNGIVNDLNAGDETDFPGLIHVTADRFSFEGNIDTPPKVGILLYGAKDAELDLHAKGGPIAYTAGHTGYFAIRSTGGGHHDIKIHAARDARGGRFVSAVFVGGLLGGSPHSVIRDSYADVHEKLLYGHGDSLTVRNSKIVDALQTDVIRFHGSYNKALNIEADNVQGGVSIYDGRYNQVRNCEFTRVRQIGVYVGKLSAGYAGDFSGTQVIGNVIEGDKTSEMSQNGGIMLDFDAAGSSDIRVKENDVSGFALSRQRLRASESRMEL